MTVSIGSRVIGGGHPAYLIAEIGLNHNGDVDIAKRLIDVAAKAGADAVKFQKRTPEISTPEHMRDVPRETPWGTMSYLDYRRRVEFGREEYVAIGDHATMLGLDWFASPVGCAERRLPRGSARRGPQGGLREPHRHRAADRAA